MLLNRVKNRWAGAERRALKKGRSRIPAGGSRSWVVEGLEKRWLLSFPIPTLPTIPTGPGHLFVVTSSPYNAVGDGVTVNTAAIQKAVNACVAAGGGTVEIPFVANTPNIYLTNQFTITGNFVNLQIDAGVTLEALARGTEGPSFFITAKDVHDIEVSGTGTVDGNGTSWWPLTDGPDLFVFNTVNNILVTGITLTDSPHEHLTFQATTNTGCNNVTINNVTINSASTSPQTDGIDPAGTNFLIENCSISDGDDDIAVKALHAVCGNITVQNCTILYGHGISVGGQTNSGLNGMIVTNCTFDGTDYGLRLKAGAPNGGLTTNISYSNITMTNVILPIYIDSYYANGDDNIPTDPTNVPTVYDPTSPTWTNISYTNIVTSWNVNDPTWSDNYYDSASAEMWGLPAQPISNVTFTNDQFQAFFGMALNFVDGMTFDNTTFIALDPFYGPYYGIPVLTSTGFDTPVDANITKVGFLNQDIGSPTVPFETSPSLYNPDSGEWTIQGDGAGLGGTSDQFNFTSASAVGDNTISAQLLNLAPVNSPAVSQAGVMYRNSTDPNDVFAAVVQDDIGNLYFEDRTTYGGAVQISSPVSAPNSPYMEVVRSGSTFTGEYSSDGIHWTTIGSPATITMGTTALAGLAATSGANGTLAQANFVNVYLAPASDVPPLITNGPTALVSPAGTSISLGVTATDVGGAGDLKYTWSALTDPETPSFDANNGGVAGSSETATVFAPGEYEFQVAITDADGVTTVSTVSVDVAQIVTNIYVSPGFQTYEIGTTNQFSAQVVDQFGGLMPDQTVTWSVTGADNTVDANGNVTMVDGPGQYEVMATAAGGAVGETEFFTQYPPQVDSITINGGAAQRSMDTLVTVLFNEPVYAFNAFSVVQRATGGGSPTPMELSANTNDYTTWTITFPDYLGYTGNSLPNGIYDFTVTAADVTSTAANLPMTQADQTYTFHRLFGDADGNGVDNNADYLLFKNSFAQTSQSLFYTSVFDFDDNGVINNSDYFQFKKDFGMQYVYNGPDAPI
jgi:hypothetical protein